MELPKERPVHYPGYPAQRFSSQAESLAGIDIPFGPWDHNTHPLPDPDETERFTEQGLTTDSLGRPLHPWAEDLLSPEKGGMVTGKGAYWHWGPNRTADPIVITNEEHPRILLIERSDTGNLALPGGFIDGDEHPHAAAQRELLEETGFSANQQGQLVYRGPVADLRTTLHAWAETSAYLFTVDEPLEVHGNDDALSADWYFVDELPDILFGSHAQLVALAIEAQSTSPTLRVLRAPSEECEIEPLQVGHMAYKHYIASHNETSIFVKEHDATQFTDPAREAHSRAYLLKEYLQYQHLRRSGFAAIPQHTHLEEERLLAMEQFDIQEGWDAIDDTVRETIVARIAELSAQWPSQQRAAALSLGEEVQHLQQEASSLSRTPPLLPAHNDARQSNIAWHPEQGVRIVDWSWADPAPKNADATMFLIDLAKSGHDVSGHLARFNRDYAIVLAGFWLAHSTWQARDAGSTVREHQVASAASALELIRAFDKNSY